MVEKYIEEIIKKCVVSEPLRVNENEESVEKLEKKIKAELPESFAKFYKKYDGEANIEGFVAGFELLPLDRVIHEYDFLKESGIEFDAVGTEAISDKPISKNKWVPFAFDGSECFLAIDLSPARRGVVGQIIGLDMEEDITYLFANSFDMFFEKLAKLVAEGKLIVEAMEDKAVVSEVTGHFFNQVSEYAIIDGNIQNVDIVLEDDFWLKEFEKQLKVKDGKSTVSSKAISKQTGSNFRIMNNPQKLSCKPFEYMDSVRELIIHNCELRDFEFITKMKNLTKLYLVGCTTPDCNVSVLADAPKLKHLSLGVMKEYIDLKKLAQSSSIRDLSVRDLENINFHELGEFKGLTTLSIDGDYPDICEVLSKLCKLKTLEINCSSLENLDFLYKLTKLEEFKLFKPAKNEDGLKAISSMAKLKEFKYPVKDLMLYKDVPSIVNAGLYYINNGKYEAFMESKLSSIVVFGDNNVTMDLIDEKIVPELESYGLNIRSIGMINRDYFDC
ncbi:MAG: SMI1/KNR4 family protein [Lachnospiraceae bacterium]|nr:SMI1/KNR4 family protein [Lachnospiraceae bacterium]